MNKEVLEDLKTGLAVLAFIVLVGLAFIFLAWAAQFALTVNIDGDGCVVERIK